MTARIVGLGQWFPETVRKNSDWPESFRTNSKRGGGDRTLVDLAGENAKASPSLSDRYLAAEEPDPFLGTHQRRVADPQMSASEAETLAAQDALRDAGIAPEKVDAVLSWSLVPDRIMPSNACRVAHRLGTTAAWAATVDAACASPIAQLELAAALIESGRARTVLITLSHLVTQVFPLEHPASPNLGDGAAAMVVIRSETPGIRTSHLVTHGEYYDSVIWCRARTPEDDSPWW